MNKEIYIRGMNWTRIKDNQGGLTLMITFKDSITQEEYIELMKRNYYFLTTREEHENLQDEIKRQEKAQVILDNQNADLQERINKAIELIDEPIYFATDKMETRKVFIGRLKEIKDILKGEDND